MPARPSPHPRLAGLALIALTAATPAGAQDWTLDRFRIDGPLPAGTAIRLADFDGDGLLDALRGTTDRVQLLLQDAAGRFGVAGEVPVGGGVAALDTGRLDPWDAHRDAAVLSTTGQLLLLRGDGTGGLNPATAPTIPPSLRSVGSDLEVVDLDGNGLDDLVVLLHNLSPFVFVADGSGGFVDLSASIGTGAVLPDPVALPADGDGDGDPDLALFSPTTLPPVLLANDGTGRLTVVQGGMPAQVPAQRAIAADLDGNGSHEIVVAGGTANATAPRVLRYSGNGYTLVGAATTVAIAGARGLALADLDGDGRRDLVILEGDGTLRRHPRLAGTLQFGTAPVLLPAAPATALGLGDLEGDGDGDLWIAGNGLSDRLLLGDGRGGFVATEDGYFRIAAGAGRVDGALFDAGGEGDPDVVTLGTDGTTHLYHNDGTGRFREQGALPALPAGTSWRQVQPAAVTSSARRDLVVLGALSFTLFDTVRVLVSRPGGYVDETALRWPAAVGRDYLAVAAVPAQQGGSTAIRDDIVAAGARGSLVYFSNQGGVYQEVPGVLPNLGPLLVEEILVGDLDGAWPADLVLIDAAGAARVVASSGSGYREVPGAVPLNTTSTDGTLGDYDGDGIMDLCLLSGSGATQILRGTGGGSFADVTAAVFPNPPGFTPTTLKAFRSDGRFWLALGRADGPDVALPWLDGSWRFGPAVELPHQGNPHTLAFLTGDLDRDGDGDLVTLRAGTAPGVVLGAANQLGHLGVAQAGREVALRVHAAPGSMAVLLTGTETAPVAVPPHGWLQLQSPFRTFAILPVPTGTTLARYPVPATLPATSVPLQLATLTASPFQAHLGNLERVVVVP